MMSHIYTERRCLPTALYPAIIVRLELVRAAGLILDKAIVDNRIRSFVQSTISTWSGRNFGCYMLAYTGMRVIAVSLLSC